MVQCFETMLMVTVGHGEVQFLIPFSCLRPYTHPQGFLRALGDDSSVNVDHLVLHLSTSTDLPFLV
jgi:hypothetical protein